MTIDLILKENGNDVDPSELAILIIMHCLKARHAICSALDASEGSKDCKLALDNMQVDCKKPERVIKSRSTRKIPPLPHSRLPSTQILHWASSALKC